MTERDSYGNYPGFHEGDRVFVEPKKREATVICQVLHYDMNETFWGNLYVKYDDGVKGLCNYWQVKRVEK